MPHSNALHCRIKARGAYFAGPMARYSLNFDSSRRDRAGRRPREAGLRADLQQSVSEHHRPRASSCSIACDEALRIIETTRSPTRPLSRSNPRRRSAMAATEAPRGMLYHRYSLDEDGSIEQAVIIPPTSQNQTTIEDDLRAFVPQWLN